MNPDLLIIYLQDETPEEIKAICQKLTPQDTVYVVVDGTLPLFYLSRLLSSPRPSPDEIAKRDDLFSRLTLPVRYIFDSSYEPGDRRWKTKKFLDVRYYQKVTFVGETPTGLFSLLPGQTYTFLDRKLAPLMPSGEGKIGEDPERGLIQFLLTSNLFLPAISFTGEIPSIKELPSSIKDNDRYHCQGKDMAEQYWKGFWWGWSHYQTVGYQGLDYSWLYSYPYQEAPPSINLKVNDLIKRSLSEEGKERERGLPKWEMRDYEKAVKSLLAGNPLLGDLTPQKSSPLSLISFPQRYAAYGIPKPLEPREKKIFSQNGEDGIIRYLLSCVGIYNFHYVEFGVENGIECNTRALWDKKDSYWKGLLMDGNYEDKKINLHKEFITAENIRPLFRKYLVPKTFDLLSIDVDGNDFYIWQAICQEYSPRIVVIEYNANAKDDLVIKYDPKFRWKRGSRYFGASFEALRLLGEKWGYRLVYAESQGVNLFFLREDLAKSDFIPFLNEPEKLYRPPKYNRGKGWVNPGDDERWVHARDLLSLRD
jgi:hypothetical protein